jgi:hypothetical protein
MESEPERSFATLRMTGMGSGDSGAGYVYSGSSSMDSSRTTVTMPFSLT